MSIDLQPIDRIEEAATVAASAMGFRSQSGRDLIHDIVSAAAPLLSGPSGIYAEVKDERQHAHDKHGPASMEAMPPDSLLRLTILMEEVGEVAREFNEASIAFRHVNPILLRKELIQVAAMATAWADVLSPEPVESAA